MSSTEQTPPAPTRTTPTAPPPQQHPTPGFSFNDTATYHWNGDVPQLVIPHSEAHDYWRRPRKAPQVDPASDPSIAQVLAHREHYIALMVSAMYDQSDAQDYPNSTDCKLFTYNGPGAISPYDVEATCRALFDATIDRCRYGFRGWPLKHDDTVTKPRKLAAEQDQTGNCVTRIENVISCLRNWKTACRDVLFDETKLWGMANHPKTAHNLKVESKRSTDGKKARGTYNLKGKKSKKMMKAEAGEDPKEQEKEAHAVLPVGLDGSQEEFDFQELVTPFAQFELDGSNIGTRGAQFGPIPLPTATPDKGQQAAFGSFLRNDQQQNWSDDSGIYPRLFSAYAPPAINAMALQDFNAGTPRDVNASYLPVPYATSAPTSNGVIPWALDASAPRGSNPFAHSVQRVGPSLQPKMTPDKTTKEAGVMLVKAGLEIANAGKRGHPTPTILDTGNTALGQINIFPNAETNIPLHDEFERWANSSSYQDGAGEGSHLSGTVVQGYQFLGGNTKIMAGMDRKCGGSTTRSSRAAGRSAIGDDSDDDQPLKKKTKR